MLRPFQQEELNRMRSFESRQVEDPSFQTTFGWLGSCKGMGGKMVTMASYLNERVEPIRVEDRAWRTVRQSHPPEGGPSACVQRPHRKPFNPERYPSTSATLVVVSSETSFEMDRWRDALERWAGDCRTVCIRAVTDIKRLVPVRDRASLNGDGLTSERLVDVLQTSRTDIIVVGSSFLERYRTLLGHISWMRIVLNDGLTDGAIWKVGQNFGNAMFPARFVWLIEALNDHNLGRLDVAHVGMMTQNGRFTRRNWLESLCSSGIVPFLIVRTPDIRVQAEAEIVKHIQVETFHPTVSDDFRTPEFISYQKEERLLNASFWVHLSPESIGILEKSERWTEIIRQVLGPDQVETPPTGELEELECPVCLNAERTSLVPCGHGMCKGCSAKVLMRGLTTVPTCPLCRARIDKIRVDRGLYVQETVRQTEREIRILVENEAFQAVRMSGLRTVTQQVHTKVTEILEASPSNQILLLCTCFSYFKTVEESIPHTPLHLTLYEPPSRNERVYYANPRMFVSSMFRRFPFELSDVTHILVIREPGANLDASEELIDMLRVWSLSRTKKELHFIFFEPETTTTTTTTTT